MRRRLRALAFALLAGMVALAGAPPRKAVVSPGKKRPPRKVQEGSPIERPEALAPYFAALDSLKAAPADETRIVRILCFGDSHTAADFWTGRLRSRLQTGYGDGGPGLLLPARPWRGYPHEGVEQDFGRRWPAESLRSGEGRAGVGLAGAALEIPPEERYVVRGDFGAFALQVIGPEPLVPAVAPPELSPEGPPPPSIPLKEKELSFLSSGQSLGVFLPAEPGPWKALSVGLPEGLRLLGLDLRSGRSGVVLDELGINGAELTDLERWDPELRRSLLEGAQASLLILAYGTNEIGRKDLEGPAYQDRVARLLKALREESGAAVLLVGPLDRMGRRRRGQNFRQATQVVQAAMRGACNDSGSAFWDARAAMGGAGSMARWRRQRLAQRDLVHLSVAGYQRLGDLLLKALDEARTNRDTEP